MESEKVGLKLNIQKMKIMASSPITSWEIDGEIVDTVSDFFFGAHWGQILYQLSHKGSPRILEWVAYPFSSGSS